jgi:hypothetical protein
MDGAKESLTHTSLLVHTSICNQAANFFGEAFGFFWNARVSLENQGVEA